MPYIVLNCPFTLAVSSVHSGRSNSVRPLRAVAGGRRTGSMHSLVFPFPRRRRACVRRPLSPKLLSQHVNGTDRSFGPKRSWVDWLTHRPRGFDVCTGPLTAQWSNPCQRRTLSRSHSIASSIFCNIFNMQGNHPGFAVDFLIRNGSHRRTTRGAGTPHPRHVSPLTGLSDPITN